MLFNGTAERDNLTGTPGNDTINGLDGDDDLFGDAGNDSLVGGEGNDDLDGGLGADTLLGESGNDFFSFGAGAKLVDGGEGSDRISLDFSNESEDFIFTYTENGSQTTGSFLDGTVVQNVERVGITSGAGNDLINVSATVNTISDDLVGGSGNDTIIGGSGDDDIFGDAGNDSLAGGEGGDNLNGGEGNDIAIFSGLRADYEIVVEGDSATVTNDARNDLTSIETIRFDDGDFNPANGEFTPADNLADEADGVPVYRFFRTDTQTQFYTTTDVERESVIANLPQYEPEGISFIGADVPETDELTGTSPVYRFFNTSTGIHLYTADENERAFVEENLDNFVFEGTPYYGYDTQVEGTVPLYRFYNEGLDAHFYTPSTEERDSFIASPEFEPEGGDGGIAFYVEPAEI